MSEHANKSGFVIPCRYLRSDTMFYGADGGSLEGSADGVFWCEKTRETFGPDGEGTGKKDCRAERSCYVSY